MKRRVRHRRARGTVPAAVPPLPGSQAGRELGDARGGLPGGGAAPQQGGAVLCRGPALTARPPSREVRATSSPSRGAKLSGTVSARMAACIHIYRLLAPRLAESAVIDSVPRAV